MSHVFAICQQISDSYFTCTKPFKIPKFCLPDYNKKKQSYELVHLRLTIYKIRADAPSMHVILANICTLRSKLQQTISMFKTVRSKEHFVFIPSANYLASLCYCM